MLIATKLTVVKKALEQVPGVTSMPVDFDKKTATVTLDPDKATSAKLTQTRTEAGFPSKIVSKLSTVIPESMLTCPSCGHAQQEIMPTDACLYFYECTQCKVLLKPKAGDCCVFCSYGSVACPPIQEQRDRCH